MYVVRRKKHTKTYTSWRYLKLDSSFGTILNWFPSRYLKKETGFY